MSQLLLLILVGGGCLLTGWLLLPQPGFVTRLAEWIGIKDRVP